MSPVDTAISPKPGDNSQKTRFVSRNLQSLYNGNEKGKKLLW